MEEVLYLSLATASISFTVTETKIFSSLREWLRVKSTIMGDLFSCGYCLGYWVAFGLTAIYQPRLFQTLRWLDYFLTALVIAWIAACQWAVMCWLMKKAER
jgi:hypothetical protein